MSHCYLNDQEECKKFETPKVDIPILINLLGWIIFITKLLGNVTSHWELA